MWVDKDRIRGSRMEIGTRYFGLSFILLFVIASAAPLIEGVKSGNEGDLMVIVFTIGEPTIVEEEGRTLVLMEGWGTSSIPDAPVLPERTFYIPEDPGDPFEVVAHRTDRMVEVRTAFPVARVPYPGAYGRIFHPDAAGEADMVTDLGRIEVNGNIYRMLRLSPFIWDEGKLLYPSSMEVELRLSSGMSGRVKVPSDLPDPTVEENAPSSPLWMPSDDDGIPDPMPSASYLDSTPPTECLIITSSALNSSLAPLAEWKTQRGLYTRIVETTWIYSNFQGVDNQEKIRNCIKAFYANESLKWVILGGDHSVVPARLAYVPDGYGDSGSDGSYAPADAYYGDISGSGATPYDWDGDNDGYYGEYSVDGVDLSLEVYVGRLSATSSSAMTSLVNNMINYEKSPPSGGWFNRSVLAGAYSNYRTSTSTNNTTDEARLKEAIRTDFLSSGNYATYTLYEGSGIWPSTYTSNASLTTSNLISAIDTGAFMVNLAGHGSSTGIYRRIWSSDSNSNGICDNGEYYDTSYYTTSASQNNGGKKPLFYNDACNNGDFDRTWCLTEDIARDVGIGAVGAARVSWYAVGWTKGTDGGWYNQGHDYRFWEQFFKGAYQPGKALALSHSDYISDKGTNTYSWKNLLQYNLIGDPEIPVWNQTPMNFNVTHADPIPTPGNYQFTVKDASGNPVQGAVVCLYNSTRFWGRSVTDAQGKASINLPEMTMNALLTVTKRNFDPYVESVTIGADTEKPQIGTPSVSCTTTGDPFLVNVTVTDDLEVRNVTILYGRGQTHPVTGTNVSMNDTGSHFIFNGTHPSNSTDTFWFRISARDGKGNWNTTDWYSQEIVDNDPPVFMTDDSTLQATTGDLFTFACNITDNIGVDMAWVNMSYDGVDWYRFALCGVAGQRHGSTMIPRNMTGTLRYRFEFNDTSGNPAQSSQFSRDVLDNDAPILIEDLTVLPPRTGNTTEFHIRAMDNIGIFRAKLVYNEEGQSVRNYTLTSTDQENFTFELDIPSDRLSNVSFRYFIMDTSGNFMNTPWTETAIIDDDLPVILSSALPDGFTTGDGFTMSVHARDNMGVYTVEVELKYPGGSSEILPGTFDPGMNRWYINGSAPASLTGNVSFTIHVTDASGNMYISPEYTRELTDNDAPSLAADSSDTESESGASVMFSVRVEDNIAVESVMLESPVLGLLNLSRSSRSESMFTLVTDVPEDFAGPLSYHFVIADSSGNSLVTENVMMNVTDAILPSAEVIGFIEEGSYVLVDEMTTGETFTVITSIDDNIGISLSVFEFTQEGNASVHLVDLSASYGHRDNFTAEISLSENLSGILHYRLRVEDTWGNEVITPWESIMVCDNDPPLLSFQEGDVDVSTGEVSRFVFRAEDNIGIVSHSIELSEHPDAVIQSHYSYPFLVITISMDESFPSPHPSLSVNVSDGNNSNGMELVLNLHDATPPTMEFLKVPEEMVLSGTYELSVIVHDNVGWRDPSVVWMGGDQGEAAAKVSVNMTEPEGTGFTAALFPPGPGSWVLNVSVFDLSRNAAIREFQYEIVDDVKPEPRIKTATTEAVSGESITLDASSSEDDSSIVGYTWTVTLPDGTEQTFTGESIDLVPTEEGDYTITLEVEDEGGNTAVASTTITVTPVPGDEDEGSGTDVLLWGAIIGSVLLFLVVILVIFLIVRKRSGGEAEEEEEEVLSWD